MAQRNYLAFDLGAESGRAVLGTLNEKKLTLAEKHRFANPMGRMNGHLQWDLLGQWEELKTGLRKAAVDQHGDVRTPIELHGIGVDAWGVDFGLISRSGEILGNPFNYRDSRTDGMYEVAFSRVPRQEIFETTGIQFMQINSLYQLLSMKESGSECLSVADTFLFVPDLFNYLFTGQRKCEFSIVTTSQMYDPRKRTWARPMLEKLGLPTNIFPEIVPSGTVIGPLREDVASECGVGQIPVIAPATHDTASAVAAVPAQGDDWCYISSGTWSLMGVELPQPLINEKSLRYNYTNEGGVGGTIRFLKNIMGLWLVQECRRQFQRDGYDHSYAELAQMAQRSKPLMALIDPDHPPFLQPGEMPRKIEEFCKRTGQQPPNTRGEFVRACLDSLALTYRKTLDGLEDVLGRRVNVIHIVGGGCQNELLNQMTANACNRPVLAGPVEATAIGNILVQAMATGDIENLADARSIVESSFEVKHYEPQEAGRWVEAYARYRKIIAS